jgi:hypothetical protein
MSTYILTAKKKSTAILPKIEDKNHLECLFKIKKKSQAATQIFFLEENSGNLPMEYYVAVRTNEVEIYILIWKTY